jgi:ATP-binding cassette subfamily F protein 3
MLTFSGLSLRRGTRLLISDASFTIYRGEKVGIVGANGCGKSSLLALILGELQPDAGSFDMPTQLVVAHVAQEMDATQRDAVEFVMDGDAELRETEAAMAAAEARDAGAALGELHARYAALGGYDAQSRRSPPARPRLLGRRRDTAGRCVLGRLAHAAQSRAGADVSL